MSLSISLWWVSDNHALHAHIQEQELLQTLLFPDVVLKEWVHGPAASFVLSNVCP